MAIKFCLVGILLKDNSPLEHLTNLIWLYITISPKLCESILYVKYLVHLMKNQFWSQSGVTTFFPFNSL